MPNYLSAEDYDRAEARAAETCPNRIVQCCQPVTFAHFGYPMRVATTAGAHRFLDVMQEQRTELTFKNYLGGFIADDEFRAMTSVAEKVAAMSERLYGRRLVPRSSLLRSLVAVRHIRWLLRDPNAVILDIGSGSGYVGALLLEFGFRYVCTDITQGFYLYQNHLLNAVTGDKLIELATDDRGFFDFGEFPANCAVHVPWWKFVVVDPAPAFNMDLVTCNHALIEMDPTARGYTLAVIHRLLKGPGLRPFYCEAWGYSPVRSVWEVVRDFSERNFVFSFNDDLATVAVRRDSDAARGALALPHANAPNPEYGYALPHYINPESTACQIIALRRSLMKQKTGRSLEEFDGMLRSVLGRDEILTDDERFLYFVEPPETKAIERDASR